MRIASLLPSATEIVFALGLGDELVAVTHECDYPPAAQNKAHVTKNRLPDGLSSAQIDQAVLESTTGVTSVYELDVDGLVALEPDLIITQDLCRVCAVPRSAVDQAAERLGRSTRVLSLDPATLDDVLGSIIDVGVATGHERAAGEIVASQRERANAVRRKVADRPTTRVACIEWFDPIFCAGHWVPEQVRLAGGTEVLGCEGEPSKVVDWEGVLATRPDVLVLMPCGYNAAETAERIGELSCRSGWDDLPAVASGRVFAVDASAYFSRPGPRLVDGIELLAEILHQSADGQPAGDGRRPPGAARSLPSSIRSIRRA
jgi:iron complex transport system substrate-binding protein